MRRHNLIQGGAVVAVCVCCYLISSLPIPGPTIAFYGYFYLTMVAVLVVEAPIGAFAILLAIVGSVISLHLHPPQHRPVPPTTVAIAEAFFFGTSVLVLVLGVRLRRQVHRATRAAENILPRLDRPAPAHLYARLIDLAPYAITVVDSRGAVVLWNQKAEDLFGYSREEILGRSVDCLVPPERRSTHSQERLRYMQTPRHRAMGQGMDLLALRKDGTTFPCEIALAPIDVQQGDSSSVIVKASITDISQRKVQEQALIAAQVQQQAAEEAVKDRDQLLAIAAHELRTPITSISGFSELVARTLADAPVPLPAAQRERLQHALAFLSTQTSRLSRLIDQLLDVSRLQTNRFTLHCENTDLVALCVEQGVLAQAGTKEHEVVLDVPTEPLRAYLDPLHIGQVLSNLLTNAVKYAPGGRIVVRLVCEAVNTAHITIKDQGPGIPLERRAWLFTRFTQAHEQIVTEAQPGLGLGLWLSREIVFLHHGEMWADFPDDGGMEVHVLLPLQHAQD